MKGENMKVILVVDKKEYSIDDYSELIEGIERVVYEYGLRNQDFIIKVRGE